MPIQPSIQEQTQLLPISLVAPAFRGLNLENSGGIMGPEWATVLDNIVFDANGRPTARKGWTTIHDTASTDVVKRILEYRSASATSYTISAHDDGAGTVTLYEGTSDRTGTLTPTTGNIKLVNFNDKCIAFGVGTGGIPAVKVGTGNFADISVASGTLPTGDVGTAAYGRVWCVDADGKTVRYSALLDETRWDTADGGGSVDFSKVWPSGQDTVVAIEEFGGDLVFFGTKDTVIITDGAASELGMDPSTIYVSDTIPGVGAVTQFGICRAAGDLWVLTRSGIVGLQRELVQKSTPVNNLSRNVQSQVVALTNSETDKDDITLMYNPVDSLVLAIFPASDTHLCFDTRNPMDDGSYRVSTWSGDLQTAAWMIGANNMYGSLTDSVGDIFQYQTNSDNGATFAIDYESSWMDLGQEMNNYIKIVKRMTTFVFITETIVATHKVAYDFGLRDNTEQKTATGGGSSQWGLAEWGSNGVYDSSNGALVAGTDVSEWSGAATTLKTMDAPIGGSGQYIQVGIRVDTASGEFSLQQINLFAKVGRLAT